MYTPALDYPFVLTIAPMIIEICTPEAVYDQVQAFYVDGLTYDNLMGIYESTASEVEAEAVKMMVMGKDWELRPAYGDEFVQYVEEVDIKNGKWTAICWARVDASTLTADSRTAAAKGDTEFSKFLGCLADAIDAAEYDQRAECSYYMRRPVKW